MKDTIPHQSRNANFPGSTIAARELGVERTHLHRVLKGERSSASLVAKWNAWLRKNPEFATLNKKAS